MGRSPWAGQIEIQDKVQANMHVGDTSHADVQSDDHLDSVDGSRS